MRRWLSPRSEKAEISRDIWVEAWRNLTESCQAGLRTLINGLFSSTTLLKGHGARSLPTLRTLSFTPKCSSAPPWKPPAPSGQTLRLSSCTWPAAIGVAYRPALEDVRLFKFVKGVLLLSTLQHNSIGHSLCIASLHASHAAPRTKVLCLYTKRSTQNNHGSL